MTQVLEVPSGNAPVPGVVILHEYWGVNEQITVTAKRWAEEGFLAIVPDLYHGKLAKTADEAKSLMGALDWGAAVKEIGEAVAALKAHPRSNGKVGVTGYCMGGALALAASVHLRGLSAVVPFYGLPGDLDWSKVDAPIQAHFARHDDWATVTGAQKIKDAVSVPMELHVYDAKHAFCNERRPEVYDKDAAKHGVGTCGRVHALPFSLSCAVIKDVCPPRRTDCSDGETLLRPDGGKRFGVGPFPCCLRGSA